MINYLLHRADETQQGRNSRPRLQFFVFSLDSVMLLPRQAFYIVSGSISLWEDKCMKQSGSISRWKAWNIREESDFLKNAIGHNSLQQKRKYRETFCA